MKDTQIIELYWQRDPQAIEETKTSHGAGLYKIAMGILRSHEDSEECVSDTYINAWRSIPPARPIYLFAYLAKICRNCALGMLDKKQAAKRRAEIVELTQELQNCLSDDQQSDPVDRVALTTALNHFLGKLSREDRSIFLRRYWYGDKIKEIAQVFGLRQGAVKTRLFRLRQRLRSHLEEEGFEV